MLGVAQLGVDLVLEIVVDAPFERDPGPPPDKIVFAHRVRIETAHVEVKSHAEIDAELAGAQRRRWKPDILRRRDARQQREQAETQRRKAHQNPFFGCSHETERTPADPPAISCALRSSSDRLGSISA